MENPPWADEAVRSNRRRPYYGRDTISVRGALPGGIIKQLVFSNPTQKNVLWPKVVQGEKPVYKVASMPKATCGIDVTYVSNGNKVEWQGMSQFVAVNAQNKSEVYIAESLPKSCIDGTCKALSTGTGLCGLYVWNGISKVQSTATTNGQAFEMEFIFYPE